MARHAVEIGWKVGLPPLTHRRDGRPLRCQGSQDETFADHSATTVWHIAMPLAGAVHCIRSGYSQFYEQLFSGANFRSDLALYHHLGTDFDEQHPNGPCEPIAARHDLLDQHQGGNGSNPQQVHPRCRAPYTSAKTARVGKRRRQWFGLGGYHEIHHSTACFRSLATVARSTSRSTGLIRKAAAPSLRPFST